MIDYIQLRISVMNAVKKPRNTALTQSTWLRQ